MGQQPGLPGGGSTDAEARCKRVYGKAVSTQVPCRLVEDLVALACELKERLLACPPRTQPAQPAKAQGSGKQRGKRKKPAEPAVDLSEEVASHFYPT